MSRGDREIVEAYLERMQTLFVLETLDNLRKNGRLTRMQSLVTGALLPVDSAGLHGGVVGPGEPPGEGDHIVVPCSPW